MSLMDPRAPAIGVLGTTPCSRTHSVDVHVIGVVVLGVFGLSGPVLATVVVLVCGSGTCRFGVKSFGRRSCRWSTWRTRIVELGVTSGTCQVPTRRGIDGSPTRLAVDELGENHEGGLGLPCMPRLESDKRSDEASGQQPKMAGSGVGVEDRRWLRPEQRDLGGGGGPAKVASRHRGRQQGGATRRRAQVPGAKERQGKRRGRNAMEQRWRRTAW